MLLLLHLWSCKSGDNDQRDRIEEPSVSMLTGEALAIQYCSSCHAYTSPMSLPKNVWRDEVLPSMGHRMGIFRGANQPDSLFEPGIGGRIVRSAGIYPPKPLLAKADYQKIIDYFVSTAPDSIPPRIREKKIITGLRHFKYQETTDASKKPPLSIMVKILDQGRGFAFGDGKKNISSLNFVTQGMDKDYSVFLKTTPVHYYELGDTIYLTTIGTKMYPHDAPNGAIQKIFRKQKEGPYVAAELILPDLQRPVFAEYADLNNDGLTDIVVCEYGHLTGKLAWYLNKGNNQYRLRMLKSAPGASLVRIRDVNGDGYPDIYALMAQGDEGVFLFTNNQNGTFKESRILTFSPINGSQYFDLIDFDGDGLEDILYVCGDNADLSTILKKFHGIYLYRNSGDGSFEKEFFYPQNGAYKAIANDFDLDGDLDIASISFFPDYARYPEESFVYLENIGESKFREYTFPEVRRGRWIVMDVGDMDADGDADIALGSFVDFYPEGDTTQLNEEWFQDGPSMIVLENTIR